MADNKPDIWVNADVYVTQQENPKIKPDGTFPEYWQLVGLLNGSDGFTQEREFSETEATAWGKGVVDKSRKDFKSTGGFTALEDNPVTHYLAWPGSTEHVITVPHPARVYVAYKTIDKDGNTLIWVTREKAEVFAGNLSKTDEVAGKQFAVTHFVDSKGGLFDQIKIKAGEKTIQKIAPIRIDGVTAEESPLVLPATGGSRCRWSTRSRESRTASRWSSARSWQPRCWWISPNPTKEETTWHSSQRMLKSMPRRPVAV